MVARGRRRRVRRNAEEWDEILRRFESSGLKSPAVFCAREGLTPSSFQRWRRRLRGAKGVLRKPGFVELVATPTQPDFSNGWSLEIELPQGIALRFRG